MTINQSTKYMEYNVNDRVEFMTRTPRARMNGKTWGGSRWQHKVGFVKKLMYNWCGHLRYIICEVNKDHRAIYIVKPRHIFGLMDKK